MPEPVILLEAMSVSVFASAIVLWIFGRAWGLARKSWIDAGWILAVGVGFLLGCWVLGNRPRWPFREDQDRLLGLVVPAIVVVELLAVWPRMPRGIVGFLQLVTVSGAAVVLLHGTSYLADVAGPGTREWSPRQAWLVLGGLASALAGVWLLLSLLSRRAPGLSHPVCLAVASAGAGLTVMLSGYATGGQDGLPLSAALLGTSAAAFLLSPSTRGASPVGVAVVLLFSLLVIGRFFGELSSAHAILLFVAPLLGWLRELPLVRGITPKVRAFAHVCLVIVLVAVVVGDAMRKFVDNSRSSTGSSSSEPSIQDYADFGR